MNKLSTMSVEMLPQYIAEQANCNYIPAAKEEILAMDYMELKILMNVNMNFYNVAIVLLDVEVAKMIEEMRSWDEELRDIKTLDDILHGTKYFGGNYEESREEFVTVLLDYIWDLAEES